MNTCVQFNLYKSKVPADCFVGCIPMYMLLVKLLLRSYHDDDVDDASVSLMGH